MHKIGCFFALLLLTVVPALSAAEDNQGRGWAVDVKAGTLGVGADLNRSIVPRVLNLRVGASFYKYSTTFTDNGIDYKADLKLGAVPIALDVFPFKNWFRLGGGAVINLTEVDGTGQTSTGSFTIGGQRYTSESIGQLKAVMKANRVAPYFGMGFNNPIKRSGHLGFFADLGVLYHGTPAVKLTTTKTFPQLQADIEKQTQKVNNDIKDYKLFPVIQLGISIKF
jgi:hypothetical protein